MTSVSPEAVPPETPFRLNLEQQKKRAKALLRRYRAADEAAQQRFFSHHPKASKVTPADVKLADAQLVLARELGVPSWAKLKQHIAAMDNSLQQIESQSKAVDSDMKTLHVRCGSDIQQVLPMAGFSGEFLEYQDPVCQGPVQKLNDEAYRQDRADFIAAAYGHLVGMSREDIYQDSVAADQRLLSAAENYQRVVLWFEHDTYDQLILIKILSLWAQAKTPAQLQMVSLNHFPGAERFIGLGQLPPEAIHLLWSSRTEVSSQQLALAVDAWDALSSDSPESLLGLMHSPRCQALPYLSRALERHLQELPSLGNGLGLTEQLSLEIIHDQPRTCGQVFRALMLEREPMPWLGDLMFWHILQNLAKADEPLISIERLEDEDWPRFPVELTEAGLAVLAGDRDYLTCGPVERWLGGVCIAPGWPVWRWDNAAQKLSLRV
ncbi:DUF1835 domain-containing protein [Maricurvus nonylphenolicus]|uniref:DUF1835 domain-containing protein n=1 Tax=Maricurvus nonylphenolicus TaxID=1008307 RepID=UPI0036F3DEA8